MLRPLDVGYGLALAVTAPWWLRRRRRDWSGRMARGLAALPPATRPRILLHAVSVGEINAIRGLVPALEAGDPGCEVVVAVTTDTGHARARELFADERTVVRYPIDFSGAVRRFLDAIRPDVVGLVELEVWPHFVGACGRRGIPVAVINGRLSARSFARYRRARWLLRPSFRRLAAVAAQSAAYADRFRAMGIDPTRVTVTGTMKWDAAPHRADEGAAAALAEAMGIDRSRPLVVAGSTAPGEHELLRDALPDGAQLLCAPRRPEWFDAAAAALPACARRSRGDRGSATGRFLLDTIGELRLAYALADVVVIGRSFAAGLHGSDMMEPAALGRAIVVGPNVGDFEDTVGALRAGDGIVTTTEADLPAVLRGLLGDAERRGALGAAARSVVERERGATERHAALLRDLAASRRARSPQ